MDTIELQLRARLEEYLDVYSLEEIFDYNDLTVVDVLVTLIQEYGLVLPEVEPLPGAD